MVQPTEASRLVARSLHALLGAVLWAGFGPAQDAPGELVVGDPAPRLDIAHWVKGEAAPEFEVDKIYVVEFWATWCGPCIANMEHLSVLQERFAESDVTFIGVSNEPLAKVVEFLFRRDANGRLMNDRTRYTLATDPDGSAWREYLDAAFVRGVPATFVVGRDGRLEWLGHPKDLESPLRQVVAGSWDRDVARKAHVARLDRTRIERELSQEFTDAKAAKEWGRALTAIDRLIEREGPESLRRPTKLRLLLIDMGNRERAIAYATELTEANWDKDDWILMQVAWAMTDATPENRDLELARRAAVRSNELTKWSDESHVSMLAKVHHLRGEHDEAVARQKQAVALVEQQRARVDPERMKDFEDYLARFVERLRTYEQKQRGG